MIAVEQRYAFDCMTAALASVFEVPYEDVPHFCDPNSGSRIIDHDWWAAYESWLRDRGWAVLQRVRIDGDGDPEWCPWAFPGYWIAGVDSPRTSGDHAIVMRGHEIVWDPHPRRDEHTNHRFTSADYFLPLNPGRLFLADEGSPMPRELEAALRRLHIAAENHYRGRGYLDAFRLKCALNGTREIARGSGA